MPRTSCGAPMAFGCSTVDDGWGWIFTAVEHWNSRVCRLACLQAAADRFAALQPISMGLFTGCTGSTAAGAARGLALRGSRLPVSRGPLHQPDQVHDGIQPILRLRRRAPVPTASPSGNQSHAEGTDHPWSHLPQHPCGSCGPLPVRDFVRTVHHAQLITSRIATRYVCRRSRLARRGSRRDLDHARRIPTNLCPRNRVRYRMKYP